MVTIESFMLALGWALLNFIWQGLIVGAVVGLLLFFMRNASPRWRYAVCALALFTCLCLPIIFLGWLLTQPANMQSQAPDLPGWLQALQTQLHALTIAWSLGVGVMTLRLCLGVAWVSRLRHQAIPAPAIWQDRLDALAVRLGMLRRVQLKLHAALSSPVTVGIWRPLVLLPAALLSGMPVQMLEALLAHELAHVRRWDYLINLLQSLVEALLFFHPVIWWLSTRMRIEREQVADELAAQALDDPHCLALALHELSLQTPTSPEPDLLLSAKGGTLLKRIERLMAPPPETASWKLAMPALLLASASLMMQAHGQNAAPETRTAAHVNADIKPAPVVAATTAPAPIFNALHLPVNARHVLVLDEGRGTVLMAKDADAIVPIASITKLMTAMVMLDARLDPNEKLRITNDDVDSLKHSRSSLPVGSEIPRAAALRVALMSSENRAAAALARSYPGGESAFMQALQAKIQSLGLTHTTITDPTGLSPTNASTANEVAKIVTAASRYPEIAQITSNKQSKVAVNGQPREFHNTNALVGDKGWDIRLSKTGHTVEAGHCLIMRIRSGDKNVTVVLLDADGSRQRMHDANAIRNSLAKLSTHTI